MKNKNVFIIGYFGYVTNQLDGQTVKTRNILAALKDKYEVEFYDTEELKKGKISLLKLPLGIIKHKKIRISTTEIRIYKI